MNMNIYQLFTGQVEQRPEAAALIKWQRNRAVNLSFLELERAVSRAATMLATSGLSAGDPILVLLPMSIDLYVALLAVWRLGLVAVFLDPSAGLQHIERCGRILPQRALIATSKAYLMRCISPALQRIPIVFLTGRLRLPGAHRWRAWKRYPPLPEVATCGPDTPALVTFTSGSTDVPKAAVRSHELLAAQQQIISAELKTSPQDLVLSGLPIFVLSNLASGAANLIPGCDLSRPAAVDAAAIVRRIQELRVTNIQTSPAILDRVADHCRCRDIRLSSIRRICTGGAPVFARLLDRIQAIAPQAEVTAVYGSTEAEPIACLPLKDLRPMERAAMDAGSGLLAGHPVAAARLRVLPNRWGTPIGPFDQSEFDGLCLGPRQSGEIVVSGPHVLKSYLCGAGDHENKIRVDGETWHRTGDAGCLDEEGRLWLLGRCVARISDQHGILYPFSVETAVDRLANVRRSAFVRANGRRTLVLELATDLLATELNLLISKLDWAHIERVLLLPHIPVDRRHNAKVDYQQLDRILMRLNCHPSRKPNRKKALLEIGIR